MGRARDQVGAFQERLLEVGADEPENVGHVVHDHGIHVGRVEILADFRDRFPVQYHAFAEDDEFRPVKIQQFTGGGHIDLVGVLGQDRETHHGRAFRMGIARNEIPEGAHGLRAQMSAPADEVVHYLPNASGFAAAVRAVNVVDHRAEKSGIGHLPAYEPHLDFRAAEVFSHFLFQQPFHFRDEVRSLIVEDVGLIKGFRFPVLGVAKRRVHN